MNLRVPLTAKILGWFFLNLILVAGVFVIFMRLHFGTGADWLLSREAGVRIQSMGEIVRGQLDDQPHEQWNDALKKLSAAYHIEFALFRPDAIQLAGGKVELPPDVRAKFNDRPGPPRRGPPDDSMGFGPEGPPGRGRPGPPPPRRPPPAEARAQDPPPISEHDFPKFIVRTTHPTRYWLLVRIPLRGDGPGNIRPAILLAQSASIKAGGLLFDFTPWVAVGAGVMILSVLFWLPLVRGITGTIGEVTRATEQIAEGQFETTVPAARNDELGTLASAINRMAARLGGFVTGQKRFLGDIAHELCAPIARMQMALGILEQRADEKQRAYVADVREELQQISALVNELLSFSKAGLRAPNIELQPVPLHEIVCRVAAREAAGGAPIEIRIDEELRVLAEPELLGRAVGNVLRNAIRYAGTAVPILVSANHEGDRVILIIADSGPGVPVSMLEQIFDPFFRVEASRSRDTGGVGLGLAIVKTCVTACRGTVTARNRQPSGLEVRIALKDAAACNRT